MKARIERVALPEQSLLASPHPYSYQDSYAAMVPASLTQPMRPGPSLVRRLAGLLH